MLGDQKRRLAARRLDQTAFKIERGKGRLQLVFQIGAQRVRPLGILAFRLVGYPAVQLLQKKAGGNQRLRAGDGVGSDHVVLLRPEIWRLRLYREMRSTGSSFRIVRIVLLNPGAMDQ